MSRLSLNRRRFFQDKRNKSYWEDREYKPYLPFFTFFLTKILNCDMIVLHQKLILKKEDLPMSNILNKLNNELAPQRTISLFKRQEERVNELNEKFSINLKYADIIREGVDLLLKEIEKQLEPSNKEGDN